MEAPLHRFLQTLGVYPMEPVPAVRFMRQMASAVAYIHSRGIIHGDLHVGNIMVQPHGGAAEAHIFVTDFGVAEILEHPRQDAVKYMVAAHPPELWFGKGAACGRK